MQGYVKNVSAVGVFVTLSSSVEARVKLGQLSDTFVEDPKAAFPVGQLVSGRILNVQGDRYVVATPCLIDRFKHVLTCSFLNSTM